jgi:DNA-binding NtrC family response regulator
MTTSTARILIADDQPDVIEALRLLLKGEGYVLKGEGYAVVSHHSPHNVIEEIEKSEFDVALIDLNYARDTTSGVEGLDLLSRLQAIDATLPVIVMTAWASLEKAVEAMRRGARDFIEKPWDNNRLVAVLRTQVELGRALRRGAKLESENRVLRATSELPELVARSPAMAPVLTMIERIGPSAANVLLTGEHGTGKEVVARRLHALSPRAPKPLVAVNVGGLSEGVFESELFGHVKGAFTDAKTDRVGRFELADGGTLLLDEIANLTLAQQSRLLRVLQTGELERVGSSKTRKVDVRVIAATNADLRAEVSAGRFREDLFFRLNTIEIHLPPLRERPEDVVPLAEHFLRHYVARYRKAVNGFDSSAVAALTRHTWPGNVRELDHAVERALLLASGPTISTADLGLGNFAGAGDVAFDQMTLEDAERTLIERALKRNAGNVTEAAKALGVSRSALYRRLASLGIRAE